MKIIAKVLAQWNGSVQEFALVEKGCGLSPMMITRTTHLSVGYARNIGTKKYIMAKWNKIVKTGIVDWY